MCGTTLMIASLTFVSFSRCVRRASAMSSDVHSSLHSATIAAIRPICAGCESSPASFPRRSRSALAEDVVFVLCTGGAPSASASGNLTRVLSAAECVGVPDVVSWTGTAGAAVVTASGSSGSVKFPSERVHGRCELSKVFLA